MKKILIAILIFCCTIVQAQKGVNKILLAGEVAIPTGDFGNYFNVGPGIISKVLFGISRFGEMTGTFGASFHSAKSELLDQGEKLTVRIFPILLGYRHSFSGFFLEPQLGVGIVGASATSGGQSESTSNNEFTWAVGFGYSKNKLELGVIYQSSEKNGGSLPLFGIHFGYLLNLGASR